VLQERAADAVAEERHRFGTVFGLDLLHAFGDVAERFVPGNLDPRFLARALWRISGARSRSGSK